MTTKNISKKILAARKMIAETPIKKEGKNSFSGYAYFTPSQISYLVRTACQDLGLLTEYNIKCNEFGYYGELIITDVESNESKVFTMVTAMPEIKATNEAQKLGGMATYNERYLKMSAFDIVDNNLDFDAKTPESPRTKSTNQTDEVKAKIREAYKKYKGEDKEAILKDLQAKAKSKGDTIDYLDSVLEKLTA